MSLLKVLHGFNTSTTYHYHAFMFIYFSHYSMHFVFSNHCHHQKVTIVTKKKERALQHPYRTRAKAKIMSEIEEVQEQMKADIEAMEDQMTTMMSMRRMMKVNTAAVATTSAAAEVDPTHPSGVNQMSHPVPDVVGQGGEALGSTDGPHVVQSKNSFPPYGLPPNYAPPNVAYTLNENLNNSTPILIENQ